MYEFVKTVVFDVKHHVRYSEHTGLIVKPNFSFTCILFCNHCCYARFLVRVSYLEIYNEEVRDLLGKDQAQRLEVCISRFLDDFGYSLLLILRYN